MDATVQQYSGICKEFFLGPYGQEMQAYAVAHNDIEINKRPAGLTCRVKQSLWYRMKGSLRRLAPSPLMDTQVSSVGGGRPKKARPRDDGVHINANRRSGEICGVTPVDSMIRGFYEDS